MPGARVQGRLLSVAQVNRAMNTSPVIGAHGMAQAVKGRDYWKSIAPVGTKEHTLKSGYVDHPEQYKKSIRIKVVRPHGVRRWRVFTDDYKRFWIEYGTRKWAKHACMARTIVYMRGAGGGLGGSRAA